LTTDDAFRTEQTQKKIWLSYKQLSSTSVSGSRILLDNGTIEVEVVEKSGADLLCRVNNNGVLGTKKGSVFPFSYYNVFYSVQVCDAYL
jgi:pyruvate kinase